MHTRKVIPLFFLSIAGISSALDEQTKSIGEELIATIREEADKDGNGGNRNYETQYIRQLQAALASQNERKLEQLIDNGSPIPMNSGKKQELLTKLEDAVDTIKKNRKDDSISKLEKMMDDARQVIESSKRPEDLDDIIARMSLSPEEYYGGDFEGGSPQIRKLQQEISSMGQTLTGWQDYLMSKERGDLAMAVNQLSTIARSKPIFRSRSQFLRLVEKEKEEANQYFENQISGFLENTRSLDQLKTTIQSLETLQLKTRSSEGRLQSLPSIINALNTLEKCYQEYLAGLPVSIEIISNSTESIGLKGNSAVIRLRAELLKILIPRYLVNHGPVEVRTGESVQDMLDRLLDEAKKREDFAACKSISDLKTTILRSGRITTPDSIALADYISGKNQMAAGQWVMAVFSLQKVLKSGSDFIPAKEIGEHLTAIQKNHPKEYEQGIEEFLSPRPPMHFGGNPFPSSFSDPRNRSVIMPGPGGVNPPAKETTTEPSPPRQEQTPAPPSPPKGETPK